MGRRINGVIFALIAATAVAIGYFKAPSDSHSEMPIAHESSGSDTVTGEVIGLTCYAAHGGRGPEHAACAAQCLRAGLPAGLLTNDGRLFVATMADHTSPGKTLAPYAAEQITAKGSALELQGVRIFQIDDFVRAAH